ncbi:hypothetical protein NZD48_05120 [Staphylococcus hyicus]|uniref:hypothetical protein n=1 Tax=Staphylococcus hyicus TaxID=1284 RepID=UPI00217D6DC9|nr:hypothetical protein [Staphylococcus hyicus]UWF57690.1 hypothetical protein NZD48_05120 [Staphylococcus hyicus]
MELILLLCSSGVAGLFTYIYLDYLTLFDTEKLETKKMFSIMFSLNSIGVFILMKSIISLWFSNEIISIILAFISASLIIIYVLNKFVYVIVISKFRDVMNKSRKNMNLNPLTFQHSIDNILSMEDYVYYVECYKDEFVNEPSMYGLLKHHQVDDNLDVSFVISTTKKFDDNVLNQSQIYYVYHKSNSSNFYKIYGFKK